MSRSRNHPPRHHALKDLFILALATLMYVCSGCVMGETGSLTVVGNHSALPKLSMPGNEVEVMIYESIEGASVMTRKDSRVEISYSNVFTNSIFGVWDKTGTMALGVRVDPLEVGNGEIRSPDLEIRSPDFIGNVAKTRAQCEENK